MRRECMGSLRSKSRCKPSVRARYLRATVARALAIAVKERKKSRTDEKAARMLASSLSMRCCSASFVLPAINLDVVGTGA